MVFKMFIGSFRLVVYAELMVCSPTQPESNQCDSGQEFVSQGLTRRKTMDEQRYPMSIRLIGVMHKETGKTYMTSVLWSDQTEIVVYRSFPDFKNMHKQMKKAFPPTNALKKSTRIIPKFQDLKSKNGGQKKGPSKSLLRLKFLEDYCEQLLSCDPRVSQSADLIRFFHPTAQDLKPEYAQNSIMVMPSDDDRTQDRTHGMGNVTQPFVTETYRCVASYETKDTKNKPFKVALDEKLDVLIKDKAGWWLVENEDKRLAWFPAPYLVQSEDDGDDGGADDDETDSPTGISVMYTAVKNYKATSVDEVSVNIGAVVEVIQKSDNGWWLIRSGAKVGYVPTLYLQPYNNPRVRMASLQQELRGSNVNLSQLQALSPGGYNPNERRHSQGNILQAPNLGGYNPNERSHSQGNILLAPNLGGYNPNERSHSQGNILLASNLGGYNPTERSHSQGNILQAPNLGGYNPNERSHSQGNILQLPSKPNRQRLGDKHRSHSMEMDRSLPAKSYGDNSGGGSPVAPVPVIRVEVDDSDRYFRSDTLGSHESESSLVSDSSEFSFSDDVSSSDGNSTLNLAQSLNEQQLRMSRTPPPGLMSSNRLSPNTSKMSPSVSDPNLFKGPSTPKVPPRPRAQEILTRCTTVTRKNASKARLSPTLGDIQSR
ncbi:NADPH oxidase organizer 1 [Merluccius polli]|uniref:NADPH oxidase organizer 1 n=1 Tax=Merluccius polli TaxID=89951 RepID=A0AA47N641_MERPO|nr:NADPH oxidase organizer 1 [Merluccius polli]